MATKKNLTTENMLAAGKSLAIFAVVASALVAVTFLITKSQIAENERLFLLKSLHVLVPDEKHDNDLFQDKFLLDEPTLNFRNKPVTIYRARLNDEPVAAIFSVTAPDGYSGAIKLLIAINIDDTIAGVRAVTHKETPGLGDAIDIEKSDWIEIFNGKSLSKPVEKRWLVKKDGGDFDQLTGATITPRAIVKMTKKTLLYFITHKQVLFESKTHVAN